MFKGSVAYTNLSARSRSTPPRCWISTDLGGVSGYSNCILINVFYAEPLPYISATPLRLRAPPMVAQVSTHSASDSTAIDLVPDGESSRRRAEGESLGTVRLQRRVSDHGGAMFTERSDAEPNGALVGRKLRTEPEATGNKGIATNGARTLLRYRGCVGRGGFFYQGTGDGIWMHFATDVFD